MSEKSSYRKIFILFSSQTIAQMLPLLAAPFVSRLFGPEDFGMLAIFISLSELIGSASTLRLEMAVPASDNFREAIIISIISFCFSFIISLISLIVLLILSFSGLAPSLNTIVILLVPIVSFVVGIGITLNYFNLKHQRYTNIAVSNISRSASQTGIQLMFGFFGQTKFGLIIGYIISSILYTFNLSITFFKEFKKIDEISKTELWRILKKYKRFPLYSFWASFLNIISLNSVIFILNYLFHKVEVGYYSFAVKYINAPLNIIGNSISNVFLEESSKNVNEKLLFKKLFYKNFKILIISSILIFTPIYFLSEDIFPLVFGDKWQISGTIVKLMVPLLALRYISNPLSFILITLGKQKIELKLQILFLFWNVAIWIIITLFSFSFISTIYFYSLALSSYYLFVIVYLNFLISRFGKTH